MQILRLNLRLAWMWTHPKSAPNHSEYNSKNDKGQVVIKKVQISDFEDTVELVSISSKPGVRYVLFCNCTE